MMTHRAKQSLGQNFLADASIIERIIEAVAPRPGDQIIEIGPGRGALTGRLVEAGASVTAIELDRELIAPLAENFKEFPNFTLVEADVLEIELASLINPGEKAKLVANLPYYIPTAILQKLAACRELFSEIVLMFQREVVERITATPGNSERGFLTVMAESAFEVERLFDVPPGAFRPAPKVRSSVIRLRPKGMSAADEAGFRDLVSRAFAQKRKTLMNNLRPIWGDAARMLELAGIDPNRRAETLSLDEWLSLYAAVKQGKSRENGP
jgi:16S rRNA (adenine1518-N6/adenine1519-N6)-dimethyltransferase